MFRSFRSIFIILQILSLLYPLFRKGRVLKLPLLLRELTILALANSALIWKYLEKRNWSPQAIKNFLQFLEKNVIK